MNEISFESNFTPRDLQIAYMSHIKRMSIKRIIMMLVIGSVLISCGVYLLIFPSETNRNSFLSWFFIAYGIFVIAYYYWRLSRMGKVAYRKLVDLHHPIHTIINDQGVFSKGSSIKSDSMWEHFTEALITDDVILLYPNRLRFVIICKRFLKNDDFSIVADLVIHKISRSKDRRKNHQPIHEESHFLAS